MHFIETGSYSARMQMSIYPSDGWTLLMPLKWTNTLSPSVPDTEVVSVESGHLIDDN
jgi:hypothetical protein